MANGTSLQKDNRARKRQEDALLREASELMTIATGKNISKETLAEVRALLGAARRLVELDAFIGGCDDPR